VKENSKQANSAELFLVIHITNISLQIVYNAHNGHKFNQDKLNPIRRVENYFPNLF
jgi:hypothetical protein